MLSIQDIEAQIVKEFSGLDDWMDRYNHLIEAGKSLPAIDSRYREQPYLISGCQSRVWLHAAYEDGRIRFTADSDAVITRGLIAMLIRVLDNRSPDEILHAPLDFIEKIGLKEHLSPTRSNGLSSMIKQMKLYALAFKAKTAKA